MAGLKRSLIVEGVHGELLNGPQSALFLFLDNLLHARSHPPIRPCRHRPDSSGSSRRHAGSSRRIRPAQASIADAESFLTPRAESPHLRPAYHRIVRDACAAETIGTIRNRGETIVASQLSSRSGSRFDGKRSDRGIRRNSPRTRSPFKKQTVFENRLSA